MSGHYLTKLDCFWQESHEDCGTEERMEKRTDCRRLMSKGLKEASSFLFLVASLLLLVRHLLLVVRHLLLIASCC